MAVYLCPIFGFDVVGYSLRKNVEQLEIQRCVQDILDRALGGVDGQILDRIWLSTGDGGYVVVQGHIQAAIQILEMFVDLIRLANSHRVDPIEVRYALHFGVVIEDKARIGPVLAGDGVNDLTRLLTKMPQDRPGQVVVSDAYRQLLVDEAQMPAGLFQKMPDLVDKHGKSHAVWNFHKGVVGVSI